MKCIQLLPPFSAVHSWILYYLLLKVLGPDFLNFLSWITCGRLAARRKMDFFLGIEKWTLPGVVMEICV
jgi:hypothetical protein